MLNEQRKGWNSKFGFLMATIGSAVGLGNIWRFPYVTGKYGGSLFILAYIVIVVLLGLTMIATELAIGRNANANVFDAYNKHKRGFGFIGIICNITCFVIISYYAVICGWILKYIVGYGVGGGFVEGGNFADVFSGFLQNKWEGIVYFVIFLALCTLVVSLGVSGGIEKLSKILMPALGVLLVFVMIVSLCMPGAIEGIKYIVIPNFGEVNANGGIGSMLLAALGQAFFSLSIGIGITTTYGSYLSKDTKIIKSSVQIAIADTIFAVIASFAIFPAVFSAGLEPASGPSLVFLTLPAVFASLGTFGIVVGCVFFILLLFAGITSCISIMEVIVCTVSEKLKLKRVVTTIIIASVLLLTGLCVSLGEGGVFGDFSLLDFFDQLTNQWLLPVTALLMVIYGGYIFGHKNLIRELSNDGMIKVRGAGVWSALVRYVVPVLILTVLVFGLLQTFGVIPTV